MVAEAAINTASLNSREIFDLFTYKEIFAAESEALEIIRNTLGVIKEEVSNEQDNQDDQVHYDMEDVLDTITEDNVHVID